MTPSGPEVIKNIRSQVDEIDPGDVSRQLGNGAVVVDVRETHEFEAGHLPGAKHVPRGPPEPRPGGTLESRIEGAVPDHDAHVVLYCQTGQRSALAAHTLKDLLGYENVESMTGGITLWKDRGYDLEVPKALSPDTRERYSPPLLIPEGGGG